MKRAFWLVIPFLFLACKGSSHDDRVDATGLWIVGAKPAALNDCDMDTSGHWMTIVQDASDSFFLTDHTMYVTTQGVLDGDAATFEFETSSCKATFTGSISGAQLAGTLKFTCGSGATACQTDLTLSGTRQLAAQAACDQIRTCSDMPDVDSYLGCIQEYAYYDGWMDANPSATAACIAKLPVSSSSCTVYDSDIEDCLDLNVDKSTCKDATTVTIYTNGGAQRDVDCNVQCQAFHGTGYVGACSSGQCTCMD